jgi:hypothetical protein
MLRQHKRREVKTGHCDGEVNHVGASQPAYRWRGQIMMTGTELALIKNALNEAERVSRFGIEVLDEADHAKDAEPAENSRLRLEIDALAMREASLRSLQKTMSEIDRGGKPTPAQHPDIDQLRADIDQLRSAGPLPVPPPR